MHARTKNLVSCIAPLVSLRAVLIPCLSAALLMLPGCLSRSLTSIRVEPGAGTQGVSVGQTAQFHAIGTYTESGHATTTEDITSQVSWQSGSTSVATINSAALATGIAAGTANITASIQGAFGPLSAASSLTVTAGTSGAGTPVSTTLTALTVIPGNQTIITTGQTAQFLAIGTYNAAPFSSDLTSQVAWQSSDTSVATVASGVVTATGIGAATITALATTTAGTVLTGTATVSVTTATTNRILTSLSVIPVNQNVTAVGETGQYLAIGTYNAAPLTADLTNQVTWISSDVKVATIDSAGLATAVGSGQSTITAMTTASDGSAIASSATFQMLGPSGQVTLPTLGIYGAGSGSGTVTGPGAISCSYIGPSTATGSGAGCTGTFAVGTVILLTAAPASGSVFDGWSSNCAASDASGNPVSDPKSPYCTITMNNNSSVGAIFDPQ